MKKPDIDYDWNDGGSWLIVENSSGDRLSTKDIQEAYSEMIDALISCRKRLMSELYYLNENELIEADIEQGYLRDIELATKALKKAGCEDDS